MRRGMTINQRAINLFTDWRNAGYAMQISAHTAFEITHGVVGTYKDHDTMLNLSTVAKSYALKEGRK